MPLCGCVDVTASWSASVLSIFVPLLLLISFDSICLAKLNCRPGAMLFSLSFLLTLALSLSLLLYQQSLILRELATFCVFFSLSLHIQFNLISG